MRLVASGRDCEIFDLGDGTVLRRQRRGRSLEGEAAVMRYVSSSGFPCPRVLDAVGADMVLERLDGPTMAQDLLAQPTVGRARAAGSLLAELHHRLHEVPAMARPGSALVHLDLHPGNVILTPGGPVVIDWTNAGDGRPEEDLAMTWLILEPFVPIVPLVADLLDAFLAAAGPSAARAGLPAAAERRLVDPNVSDEERLAVEALLTREQADRAASRGRQRDEQPSAKSSRPPAGAGGRDWLDR